MEWAITGFHHCIKHIGVLQDVLRIPEENLKPGYNAAYRLSIINEICSQYFL